MARIDNGWGLPPLPQNATTSKRTNLFAGVMSIFRKHACIKNISWRNELSVGWLVDDPPTYHILKNFTATSDRPITKNLGVGAAYYIRSRQTNTRWRAINCAIHQWRMLSKYHTPVYYFFVPETKVLWHCSKRRVRALVLLLACVRACVCGPFTTRSLITPNLKYPGRHRDQRHLSLSPL